jgi:hypothetical protein
MLVILGILLHVGWFGAHRGEFLIWRSSIVENQSQMGESGGKWDS